MALVVHVLDTGAGNVRSVRNAILKLGFEPVDVTHPNQIEQATQHALKLKEERKKEENSRNGKDKQDEGQEEEDLLTTEDFALTTDRSVIKKLIFPGVGSFGSAMRFLTSKGYAEPLRNYVKAGLPYFGICLGLQTLFEGSEEEPHEKGLGVISGVVKRFKDGQCSSRSSSSSSSSISNSSSIISSSNGKSKGDKVGYNLSVPQIGWNGLKIRKSGSRLLKHLEPRSVLENSVEENSNSDSNSNSSAAFSNRVYFVHSYCAMENQDNSDWILANTDYGVEYISAVQKGQVMACQFHPEKSGSLGLEILNGFLCGVDEPNFGAQPQEKSQEEVGVPPPPPPPPACTSLSKRIVACLDVRSNDEGDLVVTKGESYDVRESGGGQNGNPATSSSSSSNNKKKPRLEKEFQQTSTPSEISSQKGVVRNLGKPVELAARYYEEGADEITFLNITSFRSEPLDDVPMLEVLEQASERVFVPLTIGGGIRGYKDKNGNEYSALNVASRYFRAGADKVSIGSDAVTAAEKLFGELQGKPDGSSAIEQISRVYGAQAVVISFDPKRVYLSSAEEIEEAQKQGHTVIETRDLRCEDKVTLDKKCHVWYQCTIKGGREGRNIDVVSLAKAVQMLGAGEILLNSIDCDGLKQGFDVDLIRLVTEHTTLPVIASSGAGEVEHFHSVFTQTRAEAALAAGIFHRKEVPISAVKQYLAKTNLPIR